MQNDVCVMECGNLKCRYNSQSTKVPEKERFLVFMKYQTRCCGYLDPKGKAKSKRVEKPVGSRSSIRAAGKPTGSRSRHKQ